MAKKDEAKVVEETTQEKMMPISPDIKFSPEQLAAINEMISSAVRSSAQTGNSNSPLSVYGQRDPKSIERVNVKRMFGKFVLGFKDVQNDLMKSHIPKYLTYEFDPIRKLDQQPYITLLLSNDGVDVEEKKILLTDYYRDREKFEAKVVDIKVKKTIKDDGILGSRGSFAVEVDDKNNPITRSKIKAESIVETRTFMVELPGFKEPVEFIQDFLA